MTEKLPGPPKGTRSSGRALWVDVLSRYELEEHEMSLLREMVRTVDTLDRLAEIVARDGLVDPVTLKVHPAAVEARQLRIALARLSASLRLPAGDEETQDQQKGARRPQRRAGVRGVYRIKGVLSS